VNTDQTYGGVAIVFAWGLACALLAGIWYDGLRSGYDGHYVQYNSEDEARATSVFGFLKSLGRFQWLLLPKGYWVETRGYGPIRANCHFKACKFAYIAIIATTFLSAIAAKSQSNSSYCTTFFALYMLDQVIYLLAFLLLWPFRVPVLNFFWLGGRLTEICLCGLSWYWNDNYVAPNDKVAISIRLAASAALGFHGLYVMYNLIVLFAEQSLRSREILGEVLQSIENIALRVTGEEVDPRNDPELRELLVKLCESDQKTYRHTKTTPSDLQELAELNQRDWVDPSRDIHRERQGKENDPKRVVVRLRPLPQGFTEPQVMLLMETAAGAGSIADIEIIGSAAFVGVKGYYAANAVAQCFHDRFLFGTLVKCLVIDDAFGLDVPVRKADSAVEGKGNKFVRE
jgi:hypothetical protein